MSDKTVSLSELKAEINKTNEKMEMLQTKFFNAEFLILEYKKRTEELEAKMENQERKIRQLETSLLEKEEQIISKDEIIKEQAEERI